MNPLMPEPPQSAPVQHTPEELSQSHDIMGHYFSALVGLAGKPQGQLTKKDIFSAAADLMGKGAFASPEQQAKLVKGLISLPEDEASLRQFIGGQILTTSEMQGHLKGLIGGGDAG